MGRPVGKWSMVSSYRWIRGRRPRRAGSGRPTGRQQAAGAFAPAFLDGALHAAGGAYLRCRGHSSTAGSGTGGPRPQQPRAASGSSAASSAARLYLLRSLEPAEVDSAALSAAVLAYVSQPSPRSQPSRLGGVRSGLGGLVDHTGGLCGPIQPVTPSRVAVSAAASAGLVGATSGLFRDVGDLDGGIGRPAGHTSAMSSAATDACCTHSGGVRSPGACSTGFPAATEPTAATGPQPTDASTPSWALLSVSLPRPVDLCGTDLLIRGEPCSPKGRPNHMRADHQVQPSVRGARVRRLHASPQTAPHCRGLVAGSWSWTAKDASSTACRFGTPAASLLCN